jgi:formylglycine-generating enzyme required for sulfatase activity
MSRILLCALIAVVVAGCSNNGPDVEALPTIQPNSGGEMVLVPAGMFTMGDSTAADATPHTVSLTTFYVDKYLVTQELYEQVMGVYPSKN